MSKKVLLIEDDLQMQKFIIEYLKDYDFDCIAFDQPKDALEEFKKENDYCIIILDLMLPEMDGFDLFKKLKQINDIPIIISSARGDIGNKIHGFELGADDYLAKPYNLLELHARIKAAIRRKNQEGKKSISFKNITLDPEERTVFVNEHPLILNRKEFDLLYYFIIRPEKTLQKTTLAELVWGDHIDQADSLDFIYSQIKNLRKKLKEAHSDADFHAVYGIGYKLV